MKCRGSRKVDVRLLGKGNSHAHGARPVHLIITMMKWLRTSRLSIQNSLSVEVDQLQLRRAVRPPGVCVVLCVEGFISNTVFFKSFCRSRLPQKSVNLSFAIAGMKNKLTDLCGN